MFRLSIAFRMTLGLVMMTVSTIMLANLVGILPDANKLRTDRKVAVCESLAINCSLLAQRDDAEGIAANLKLATARNKDILSIALRRADGRIVYQVGDHADHWKPNSNPRDGHKLSTKENIIVPILNQGRVWGNIEVAFDSEQTGLWSLVLQSHQYMGLFLFCGALNAVGIFTYLRRTLTYLDPAQAVPERVRTALDTLAEGLVVLDSEQRIVLANQSFAKKVGKPAEQLQGVPVDQIGWQPAGDSNDTQHPWEFAAESREAAVGKKLALPTKDHGERVFLVNASPISDEKGEHKGVLASFDDITVLERKHVEMENMLVELRDSREEIKTRNTELQMLANHDALTGCLNRRTFFESFEKLWAAARRHEQPLSCMMLDIDYFKAINDNYGHSMGDEVLRKVAQSIQNTCRDEDSLCRYGGEEFCMVNPHLSIEECEQAAERIRQLVRSVTISNPEVHVTISIGVSAIVFGAQDPQEMLDQADKAMYVAKRDGRNRVCRWDQLTEFDMNQQEQKLARTPAESVSHEHDETIPYPAVASLLSALSFRDPATAAHSTRVAEMSVATARGLMSVRDAYILETAALLHDIGKIGVPDRILMKPGPLTEEEWRIMEVHDQIGVDIVASSFANQKLVDIVRFHHSRFEPNADSPNLPHGDGIPVGARIVTIADAYDAMVSDRVYRKGRSQAEAFAELRRYEGRQFDPRLVERFIAVMEDYHESESMSTLSKQTALQLGLQMEQLASAMDDQDVKQIESLAGLLETTAAKHRVPQVEQLAGLLRETAEDDPDMHQLVSMTRDLLDLCRAAQRTHIKSTPESIEADAARRMPATAEGA